MVCIGVDPGLSGAVAVLDQAGALVTLHDTPTLALSTSRGTKQEYDVPGLVALVQRYTGSPPHVILGESQAMPGQGVRSMWTTGYGYGIWLGLLAALQIPYTTVRPALWKRTLGLRKDKEAARLRAMQLFP